VTRKGRVLATLDVPLGPTRFQTASSVSWKVPRTVRPGQRTACLVAADPSGNKSRKECAAILVT
jgi:hypothetical protein